MSKKRVAEKSDFIIDVEGLSDNRVLAAAALHSLGRTALVTSRANSSHAPARALLRCTAPVSRNNVISAQPNPFLQRRHIRSVVIDVAVGVDHP
jgi:hypothetical protein